MKYLVFIAYYAFLCFLLYGNYHIIFELHQSKWWLLSLLLSGISPTFTSSGDKIDAK